MIPKEIRIPHDSNAHAFWFEGGALHHVNCGNNWNKAVDFVWRARDRKIGSYATYLVNGKHRVLEASFYGPLAKYDGKDSVAFDCHWVEDLCAEEEPPRISALELIMQHCPPPAGKLPDWALKLEREYDDVDFIVESSGVRVSSWLVNGNLSYSGERYFFVPEPFGPAEFKTCSFTIEDVRRFDSFEALVAGCAS